MKNYYTVGTAGHIDHGKTSLIKALTNVNTDRLKEEQERSISIELGFAPLDLNEDTYISFIDVPGHEKFIRQMISGVTGIDLMMLVVAADEGVMAQTREHLEILKLLEVKRGIVVITKIDRVEPDFVELVKEEVKEQLKGTTFYNSPFVCVDNLSKKGIEDLKNLLAKEVKMLESRGVSGAFRMPIDQVFTIHGQGTIVRGTVYEGQLQVGDQLQVLPQGKTLRARQLHVFGAPSEMVVAGQRAAVNITLDKDEVKRGDVLIASDQFQVTSVIDVAATFLKNVKHPIKQRMPIKLHIGTSELTGKLVFFDRNQVENTAEQVLCQIRLDANVVAKRGDRFIIRRPSPVETLGGGSVIKPVGSKYKFGEETIQKLRKSQQGSPIERMVEVLTTKGTLTRGDLQELAGVTMEEINQGNEQGVIVRFGKDSFTTKAQIEKVKSQLLVKILDFQRAYPMKQGLSKAECVQLNHESLVESALEELVEDQKIKYSTHFISTYEFVPSYPSQWATRMEKVVEALAEDQLSVRPWEEYGKEHGLPEEVYADLRVFLLSTKQAYSLNATHLISGETCSQVVELLKKNTGEQFTLQEAKEQLNISRKHLILLLELLDEQGITIRMDTVRKWSGKNL